MFEKRGGQVTVFIIIGLVIIIGFGILLYLTQLKEVVEVEEILYPQEVETVTSYITDCAKEAGKEAAIILGSQGGFVEFPPEIEFERTSYLRLDDFGLHKVPYWYVGRESRVPPLDYMQWQITQYVTNQTLNCLDNFNAFAGQFQITPQDDMTVVTTIADRDIVIEIYYPLKISTGRPALVRRT